MNKVDLLKQAMRMYHGDVCSSVGTDHWLLQTAAHYRLMYHACVNELLKALDDVGDYPDIMKYATLSLAVAPENKEAYFYLICALFHRGLPDMAKSQIRIAKSYLTEEEYSDLIGYLSQRSDVPVGFQFQ